MPRVSPQRNAITRRGCRSATGITRRRDAHGAECSHSVGMHPASGTLAQRRDASRQSNAPLRRDTSRRSRANHRQTAKRRVLSYGYQSGKPLVRTAESIIARHALLKFLQNSKSNVKAMCADAHCRRNLLEFCRNFKSAVSRQ